MQEPETMSKAIEKLNKKGYTDGFRAEKGKLVAVTAKLSFEPATLIVDEVLRFEGETDIEDEAAIFALRDEKSGVKGTYTIAFSTDMDPSDAEIMPKLNVKK